MITWGTTVNKGPTFTDRGPKCAGTVPPPQDFHFNHWHRLRSWMMVQWQGWDPWGLSLN